MAYFFLRFFALILLSLLAYGQTFQYGFVFDDQYFIVNNPFIRSIAQVPLMWHVFPVTRLIGMYSFALNYHFSQLHAQGYHIFNFIIHLTATGLVWALADLLFKITKVLPAKDPVTKELPFIIALVFLVHPGQTQAVTYITQRFESMAAVFYLVTIYCYLNARVSTDEGRRVALLVLAGVSFILGMLTKEVIITMPVMILASEWILFPKKNNKTLYMALALAGVAAVVVLKKMLHTGFDFFLHTIPSESHDGDILTPVHYLLTQMRVFLTFLRLLVLPIHQNLDYDYPASTGLLHPPLTLLGLIVIAGIIYGIIKFRHKFPLISWGLSWVLITFSINLAPRSNVIFEHKLYLISVGFILAVVAILSTLIGDRKTLLKILSCIIAVLAVITFQRNKVWMNDLTLWEDAVKGFPHKARPFNNLGLAYFHQGDLALAMADYNKALEIRPDYSESYNNRGLLYFREGEFARAILDFNQAIEKNPNPAAAFSNYSNRGLAYFHLGNYNQAMEDYNRAIGINPYFAEVYSNRGLLYYNQGNFIQAIADYSKAIDLAPDISVEYNNRGTCYEHLGKFHEAFADYSKAVENDPNNAQAVKNRDMADYQIRNL